jgi:hypothetical protein
MSEKMSTLTAADFLKIRTDRIDRDLANRKITLFTYQTRLAEYMDDYAHGKTEEINPDYEAFEEEFRKRTQGKL